jgi:hypothetical protein
MRRYGICGYTAFCSTIRSLQVRSEIHVCVLKPTRFFIIDLCEQENGPWMRVWVCATAAAITDDLGRTRILGSRDSKRRCLHVFVYMRWVTSRRL